MKIQYEVFVSRYNEQGYCYQDIMVTPICYSCKNRVRPLEALEGKNIALTWPLFCPFCGEKLEYPDDFNGKIEINCHEDGKGEGRMFCNEVSYPWKEAK